MADVMKRIQRTHSYRLVERGSPECSHEFTEEGPEFRRCATWYQMWVCTKCSAWVEEQLGDDRESKPPTTIPLEGHYWTEGGELI